MTSLLYLLFTGLHDKKFFAAKIRPANYEYVFEYIRTPPLNKTIFCHFSYSVVWNAYTEMSN